MTAELDFSKWDGGLIPAIAQDWQTGEVLMVAFMNQDSWMMTLETGRACYWSRSRKKLWKKGEESGHFQIVKEILVDCDLDTIVLKVDQQGGAACHEGYNSCFYRKLEDGEWKLFKSAKVFNPEEVYKKK